jgi:hypothetical protein
VLSDSMSCLDGFKSSFQTDNRRLTLEMVAQDIDTPTTYDSRSLTIHFHCLE